MFVQPTKPPPPAAFSWMLVGGAAVGALVLATCLALFCFCWRRRSEKESVELAVDKMAGVTKAEIEKANVKAAALEGDHDETTTPSEAKAEANAQGPERRKKRFSLSDQLDGLSFRVKHGRTRRESLLEGKILEEEEEEDAPRPTGKEKAKRKHRNSKLGASSSKAEIEEEVALREKFGKRAAPLARSFRGNPDDADVADVDDVDLFAEDPGKARSDEPKFRSFSGEMLMKALRSFEGSPPKDSPKSKKGRGEEVKGSSSDDTNEATATPAAT
eukprot:910454-Prorocentrum_minimum.AAC.5